MHFLFRHLYIGAFGGIYVKLYLYGQGGQGGGGGLSMILRNYDKQTLGKV